MKKLIVLMAATLSFASTAFAQLGSLATDLVYTPVTPCRVFDTRPSKGGTGPIAAAGTKNFYIYGQTTYAGQGGAASNCGITAGNNTAAVALNVTVVTPAAAGYVTAYPFATTLPTAATVNFQAGDIARGNFTIAKVAQSGLFDLSVYSSSNADVVGDVVGFYSKPIAGALSFTTVNGAAVSVAANSEANSGQLNCPAGVTAVNLSFIGSMNLVMKDSVLNASYGNFFVQNLSGSAQSFTGKVSCIQIPGR